MTHVAPIFFLLRFFPYSQRKISRAFRTEWQKFPRALDNVTARSFRWIKGGAPNHPPPTHLEYCGKNALVRMYLRKRRRRIANRLEDTLGYGDSRANCFFHGTCLNVWDPPVEPLGGLVESWKHSGHFLFLFSERRRVKKHTANGKRTLRVSRLFLSLSDQLGPRYLGLICHFQKEGTGYITEGKKMVKILSVRLIKVEFHEFLFHFDAHT